MYKERKEKRIVFSCCLLALMLTAVVGTGCSSRESASPAQVKSKPGYVQIYAHRGVRSYAPENTVQGIKTAIALGTDFIDLDICVTKDGALIVYNDLWLNPDTTRDELKNYIASAAGKTDFIKKAGNEPSKAIETLLVKNLTLAEIQKYDVGKINPASDYAKFFPDQASFDNVKIPTLQEIVRAVKDSAGRSVDFLIEFKTNPVHPEWTTAPAEFAAKLYAVMKEENILDRCEVQSFDFRYLQEMKKLDNKIRLTYLTGSGNEQPGSDADFRSPDPAIAGLWTGGVFLKDYDNSIPKMIKALAGDSPACWSPEDVELTKEALDEAHALGLKVVVWTWTEHTKTDFNKDLYVKLMEWGVDGINTDDTARLSSLLAARGYRIPQRIVVK